MNTIGYLETIAKNEEDYINKAVNLASDLDKLSLVRSSLRSKMQDSELMDLNKFTSNLEHTLIDYYKLIERSANKLNEL